MIGLQRQPVEVKEPRGTRGLHVHSFVLDVMFDVEYALTLKRGINEFGRATF